MTRKVWLTLFMLIGIVFSASCNPKQISPTPEANMPNPASVHCKQNGGKVELRQDALGGVIGMCVFPDGSECDEWAYFRGECKPGDSLVMSESTSTDMERGREALETFFSLLHDQRYDKAVNYYGGSYDVLRDWNPTVAQDDFATLWRNGCTINGLQCLKIETVVLHEEVSPTEFGFIVEFMNDDGTLFTRGPSETQFEYTVKKVDNKFLVQDLPIYVS